MSDTPRQPVVFDRDTLRLSIGDRSTVVPDPAAGNEAMLRSYLALVADVRGTPIGSGIHVRHDDVVVLAEILDLSDVDLDLHLANLLGVSANDAADVHRRLRRHRALTAAATLTVGGLAFLGATNVSAAAPTPSPASATHIVAITTSEPEVTTTTAAITPTTEAPPVTAATVDDAPAPDTAPATPPPSDHTSPTSPDDVEIGDALVIERGQPPADPDTQIGDAITYER